MRHQKSGRKFGRNSSHRAAMFRNMVTSLIEHERITTTEAKAKELRRFAERTITKSLRVGEIMDKAVEERTPAEQAQLVHAMRMAGRMIRSREMIHKLFEELAPKLRGRNGGFTRVLKLGRRPGDGAPMAVVELVGIADQPAGDGGEPGADASAA
jgi:large subunit ribosomal protein L17